MRLLILGRGKTGSLVAEVARERGHDLEVLSARDNPKDSAPALDKIKKCDIVIDFTTSQAVLDNITACARSGKSMVVGTTGWYEHLDKVREEVEKNRIGFLYGANFSIGVNIFFEVARTASPAIAHGYFGQIFERHHAKKKDAPSGTALTLQRVIQESAGEAPEIISFREGDVVGMHELVLDSPNDTLYLCHDAKSRRGFAEGAVRGAEWLAGKKGFFDFRDVWREL